MTNIYGLKKWIKETQERIKTMEKELRKLSSKMLSDTSYKTRSLIEKPTLFIGGSISQIIEGEPVYPHYQSFKVPAEAITQFKNKLKAKIKGELI